MKFFFKTLQANRQPYRVFLTLSLLLAAVISVAGVITTRLTGELGQAALDMDTTALVHFILIVTGLTAIRAITSALLALLVGRYGAKVGYNFRQNFAKYFLQRPFAAFEGANSGESLSLFSNDLPGAIGLVSAHGLRLFSDILLILVTFVYMLMLNTVLTLIFFASFPAIMILQILLAAPIQKTQAKWLETRATVTAVVNDSLQNTSTVAAYSLEDVVVRRTANAFDDVVAATKKYALSLVPIAMFGMVISFTPLIILVSIAANRVIGGYMSVAEFIAFTGLAGETASFLGMLSQRQSSIQTAAAGAKRVLEAMETPVEDLEKGSAIENEKSDIAVLAEDLTFSYSRPTSGEEDVPLALDGVNFAIEKGSRVAFVGGSGSGKSTVLKLLLGLYAPNSGKLNVLGSGVDDVSLGSLRDTFAYVPQDSFLFPESIGANITGETEFTDLPRLEKACKDAGIFDFIQTLPDKFNSSLNESAENISGGQKQRIALARAFYRNAPIILFDEATSALDPATETAILENFNAMTQGKTVIMVAHRIKAISFCDTIIVMDGGKVASAGTHDQLLTSCKVYKNLYENQTKGAA